MATFLTILGGISGIVAALYGVFKYVTWAASKTPEQKKEVVDQTVATEESKFDDTGRPTW